MPQRHTSSFIFNLNYCRRVGLWVLKLDGLFEELLWQINGSSMYSEQMNIRFKIVNFCTTWLRWTNCKDSNGKSYGVQRLELSTLAMGKMFACNKLVCMSNFCLISTYNSTTMYIHVIISSGNQMLSKMRTGSAFI